MSKKTPLYLLALCAALYAYTGQACERARNQYLHFRAANPCPATGKTKGACPGYVVDHIVALCKDGADSPANMQWQTKADAKAKDRWECK